MPPSLQASEVFDRFQLLTVTPVPSRSFAMASRFKRCDRVKVMRQTRHRRIHPQLPHPQCRRPEAAEDYWAKNSPGKTAPALPL
jgi:hypothetical protein